MLAPNVNYSISQAAFTIVYTTVNTKQNQFSNNKY